MANVCTSCNRDIAQGKVATRFPCPSCGQAEMVRCAKCRRLSNTYVCSSCGNKGP